MKELELRIFDLRRDIEALLPFSDFVKVLLQVSGQVVHSKWSILRGADGYGEKVCDIAESLETRDSVVVNSVELLPVLLSGSEYFDNANIRLVGTNVEFGIQDSAFYYVRGNEDLLRAVAEHFTKVQFVKRSSVAD